MAILPVLAAAADDGGGVKPVETFAEIPSTTHVGILYYTQKLPLEATTNACVQPPAPDKMLDKMVSTATPPHKAGKKKERMGNYFYWLDKGSSRWVYGGNFSNIESILTPKARIEIKAVSPAASENTSQTTQISLDQLKEANDQLNVRNDHEALPVSGQDQSSNGAGKKEETPVEAKTKIKIHGLTLYGIINTDSLKLCPFPKNPFFKSYFENQPTGRDYCCTMADLELAEAWIAAYCAANNHTIGGRNGNEVFGVSVLVRYTCKVGDAYNLYYYVAYGSLDKSTGAVNNVKYGVAPEFDFGFNSLNPVSGDSQRSAQLAAATEAGVATKATETAPPPPSATDWFFNHFNPTLPSWDYDKTAGLEGSVKFKFQPTTHDALGKDSSLPISFPFGGMKSLNHDFYSASAGPQLKLSDSQTLSGTFSHSDLPKGGASQTATGGKVVYAQTYQDTVYSLSYNETLGYNATSTPPSNTSVARTTQNNDEYSSTTFFQSLFYMGDGAAKGGALKPRDVARDPSKLGANGEVDLNAWLKPSESSQDSGFYADVLSRVHLGLDVPTPQFFPGPVEFLRFDFSLTGGGIVGHEPSSVRFNAGSNLNEGVTSPDLPTQPTVRSLGANSANVYSPAFKTSGAISYGNASLTVAVPIPFSSWTVYRRPKASSDDLSTTHDSEQDPQGLQYPEDQNNLDYAAYYASILSVKPLLAFDAAYLGAPSGFEDRTLVSLGGGGEFSIGSLNVDLLYAKTFVDTSTQAKSANLTVQFTYDIHF